MSIIEIIIIGIFSVAMTILFFCWLSRHGDKQLLSAMRSDGLTEDEIIKITGVDEYNRISDHDNHLKGYRKELIDEQAEALNKKKKDTWSWIGEDTYFYKRDCGHYDGGYCNSDHARDQRLFGRARCLIDQNRSCKY